MMIPRTDLRTAIVVKTVCKLYDETGDITTAMKILARYVTPAVIDRVLQHPDQRRRA